MQGRFYEAEAELKKCLKTHSNNYTLLENYNKHFGLILELIMTKRQNASDSHENISLRNIIPELKFSLRTTYAY